MATTARASVTSGAKLTAVAASVGVVGLSWLVGAVGGHRGFDWGLAATFGTALGTTLLAITTGGLAYLTLREVSATQELAALTKRDQDARERPVVIQHSAVYQSRATPGQPLEEWLSVELVNVGLGPALRVQVDARYDDEEYRPDVTPFTWPAIMPGGMARFALRVRFDTHPPGGVRPDGFPLRGTYLDRGRSTEYNIITDWRTT